MPELQNLQFTAHVDLQILNRRFPVILMANGSVAARDDGDHAYIPVVVTEEGFLR